MDSQRKKDAALIIAISLIAVISVILIGLGIMTLRDGEKQEIVGARYVFSRDSGYECR